VRWFFRVGGAAGAIAKSMSAYDMKVSDAIYGHAERYVSRGRLQAMLDREFDLDVERLGRERGDNTSFSPSQIRWSHEATAETMSVTDGWGLNFRAGPMTGRARS
jgi:hypothetical protein